MEARQGTDGANQAKVVIERDVEAKMRDGCILRAHVYRPDDDERHPVLLVRTPYGKEPGFIEQAGPVIPPVLVAVAAGYVVIVQDVRSAGTSDGEDFFPYRDELDDGYDTVEWAASLPYCDGKVGLAGISYLAGTAWQAASAAPPSLRALVALQGPRDFYDVWWRGGALRLPELTMWMLLNRLQDCMRRGAFERLGELVAALDDFDRLSRHVPIRTFPPAHPEDPAFAPFFFEILDHPTPDEWSGSILKGVGHHDVRAPALVIGGWYDNYLASDIGHFVEMRANAATAEARDETRLVIGPWSHGDFRAGLGERSFGTGAAFGAGGVPLTTLELAWMDRWLRDIPNPLFDTPRVWVFVQGANRWRHAEDWPIPGATDVVWHLHGDGGLAQSPAAAEQAPDSYVYDPNDPCPTRGGSSMAVHPNGPVDQALILSRSDVLAYTSAPLEVDMEVVGPVTAVLYAATTAPDTDWVVKLCDVGPDGRTINVTDGILRARYRHGLDQPTLVEPGAIERYEIQLDPTGMLFRAGHRLRVLVTSSDFPRYDRNPNTGELGIDAERFEPATQQIFHDGTRASCIVLPTVPVGQ